MTTGTSAQLIPQDVQLVEDGITAESYGNDVYLDCQQIQLSSHQSSSNLGNLFQEVAESPIGGNSGLYMETTDGIQYAGGNVVIQTVSEPEIQQSKNMFTKTDSSQVNNFIFEYFFINICSFFIN